MMEKVSSPTVSGYQGPRDREYNDPDPGHSDEESEL